ncbi:MAG: MaoC family dehydratase N-terminal domain-containing protein [Kordiimonadaceae bacterium]|nr:MaoC family dehydratase N-terminal domain-containing protein [Kordiimonadaceae bacterium]
MTKPAPQSSNDPVGIDAKITDEDVDRCKRQIGVPEFPRSETFNPTPDLSTMSHFAFGYGDDNPLFHMPDYGEATRWRGTIAPPLYFISIGTRETPAYDAETKKLMKGLFRGVGRYYSGVAWEWYAPVYPGDDVFMERSKSDVKIKKSAFSGGRSVIETYRHMWVNRYGAPLATSYESYLNAERGGSKKANKYADIKRQTYTPEDIAEIDKVYAAEITRGREPRYWEDVEIGDTLTPVAKGPLTVVDVISMHIAFGWGGYGIGPAKYSWHKRQRMPAFFTEDEYGVPDVVQRLHWDQQRAEALGLPAPYDYGQMRTCWMSHLLTNWMGDDAWLWKLKTEVRSFNFLGDTHICSAEIVDKRIEGKHCIVELALKGTNQRGDVTCPGEATIILPSREHGPILLPTAPDDVSKRGAEMTAEAAARKAQD